MKMKFIIYIFLISLIGCRSASWLDNRSTAEFQPEDYKIFPEYFSNYFPGVKVFSKHYATVAEASKGLKLIEVKRLTLNDEPYNEANLAWSKDGVNLGYEIVTKTHRKIYLKDLKGNFSSEILLLPKSQSAHLDSLLKRRIHSFNGSLRWSGDNRHYAFMSNGGKGEFNIYIGGIGLDQYPIAEDPQKDAHASWNPVKNEVAFVSSRSGNGDLYLYGQTEKKLERLSNTSEMEMYPEWSNDGRSIFYSTGASGRQKIQVVERKDQIWSKPRVLTAGLNDSIRPVPSPNGRYIAFYSRSTKTVSVKGRALDQDSLWDLYLVSATRNAEGMNYTSAERIASDIVIDLNTGPAWTPDSRKVIFSKREQERFNPIFGYDVVSRKRYFLDTGTKMNRDIQVSKLGVLSFRAQVGSWDRVFLALTNQGLGLQQQGVR